jgi:hypothetical protein
MKSIVRTASLFLLAATLATGADLPVAGAQGQKDKDKAKPATASAVFELYKDSAGEFRFRLRDDQGALLAASGKGYKTKADCQKVIDAIRKEAARARLDDQVK